MAEEMQTIKQNITIYIYDRALVSNSEISH